jgi:hypothetical protein
MSAVERNKALAAMSLAEAMEYQAGIEALANELMDKAKKTPAEREMLDFCNEDGAWEANRTVREARAKESKAA